MSILHFNLTVIQTKARNGNCIMALSQYFFIGSKTSLMKANLRNNVVLPKEIFQFNILYEIDYSLFYNIETVANGLVWFNIKIKQQINENKNQIYLLT